MILDNLADEEEQLVWQVEHVADIAQSEQAGLFMAYSCVHTAYALLLQDPVSGMEALKRALFLQWYGWLEPLPITGIRDIDSNMQWRVMQQVDHVVGQHELDRDLACMLDWYNALTPWFFDEAPGLPAVGSYLERSYSVLDTGAGFPNLQNYLQTAHPVLDLAAVFTPATLLHRGQMGIYFLSMLHAQDRADSQNRKPW